MRWGGLGSGFAHSMSFPGYVYGEYNPPGGRHVRDASGCSLRVAHKTARHIIARIIARRLDCNYGHCIWSDTGRVVPAALRAAGGPKRSVAVLIALLTVERNSHFESVLLLAATTIRTGRRAPSLWHSGVRSNPTSMRTSHG